MNQPIIKKPDQVKLLLITKNESSRTDSERLFADCLLQLVHYIEEKERNHESKKRYDQLNPEMFSGNEQKMFDDLRLELTQVAERHMTKAKTDSETVAIAGALIEFSKCILKSDLVPLLGEFSRKAKLRSNLKKF